MAASKELHLIRRPDGMPRADDFKLIETIVADTRKAFTPTGLWPIHPDDGPPEWGALTGLYFGAAGVIWALDYLQREETAHEGATFAEHLGDIQARNAQLRLARKRKKA